MQDLSAVGGQRCRTRKIAAVRVERDAIGIFERANEIGDGILSVYEATVHIIAGIEQDKNVRSADEGSEAGGGQVVGHVR